MLLRGLTLLVRCGNKPLSQTLAPRPHRHHHGHHHHHHGHHNGAPHAPPQQQPVEGQLQHANGNGNGHAKPSPSQPQQGPAEAAAGGRAGPARSAQLRLAHVVRVLLAPSRMQHGDVALMCLASAQIVYSFIMMPETLPVVGCFGDGRERGAAREV